MLRLELKCQQRGGGWLSPIMAFGAHDTTRTFLVSNRHQRRWGKGSGSPPTHLPTNQQASTIADVVVGSNEICNPPPSLSGSVDVEALLSSKWK